jgi:hypothetical protein
MAISSERNKALVPSNKEVDKREEGGSSSISFIHESERR